MRVGETAAAAGTAARSEAAHWRAELQLGFRRRGARTVLVDRRQLGPLTVQRPFYPEGGVCHVYLLHPPGGVVAGDRLAIAAHADRDADVLLTTPAAGKFYRSEDACAQQTVELSVAENASLEWLPQESIVFSGARLQSSVDVNLTGNAAFIGWEIFALGRPASGEEFDRGLMLTAWRIMRDGRPLLRERLSVDPNAYRARWGLNRRCVCATLAALPASKKELELVRNLIDTNAGCGVTLLDDLLICRVLADKTEVARRFLEQVRAAIRPAVLHRSDCTPRIWAT